MSTQAITEEKRTRAISSNRRVYWLSRNWMLLFSLGYGLFVGLPFLAPVFMQVGRQGMGNVIYFIYSFLCHQMPQRSLFLFGTSSMYSLDFIQTIWQNTIDPLVLRQFIGTPDIGWKVAWSDRMISMYASVLVFAWLWYPLRKKIKPLPWWGLALFMIPMGIDGLTHMVSDLSGIGQGFRYTNAWLAEMTNHTLEANFYAGDAIGSFNSWMRWITGTLFGLGIVWYGFPFLDEYFTSISSTIRMKFKRSGLDL